jgi:hypothetical protein
LSSTDPVLLPLVEQSLDLLLAMALAEVEQCEGVERKALLDRLNAGQA